MTNRTGQDKDNALQHSGGSLRDSSLPQSGLLRVCRIGRAQGLKGEVNVQVFTDTPETRFAAGAVLADRSGKLYAVERSRTFKDRWIVKFADINDRNASERLKGAVLFIKKSAGKSTGTTPQAGAVAVTNGHVAYVESVNADGSYTVSEMGWNYKAGNYNKRTVRSGTFGQFIY